MTNKRGKSPKTHADHITSTTVLTDNVKRTYSAKLREHALWLDGEIIATLHVMGIAWSLVSGNPESGDGSHRRFVGTFLDETQGIAALDLLSV